MKRLNNQSGFTLIELVVVIVILGILAATAAPRFINLQDEAQTASLQAVEASLKSVSTLVHSKSLIAGNDTAGTANVTVNGAARAIRNGYPRSDSNAVALVNWRDVYLDMDFNNEFEIRIIGVTGQPNHIVIYPNGGTAPTNANFPADPDDPQDGESNCFAFYAETTDPTVPPAINTVPCI